MDLKNKKVISLTKEDLEKEIKEFEKKENLKETRILYGNNTVLKIMRN